MEIRNQGSWDPGQQYLCFPQLHLFIFKALFFQVQWSYLGQIQTRDGWTRGQGSQCMNNCGKKYSTLIKPYFIICVHFFFFFLTFHNLFHKNFLKMTFFNGNAASSCGSIMVQIQIAKINLFWLKKTSFLIKVFAPGWSGFLIIMRLYYFEKLQWDQDPEVTTGGKDKEEENRKW